MLGLQCGRPLRHERLKPRDGGAIAGVIDCFRLKTGSDRYRSVDARLRPPPAARPCWWTVAGVAQGFFAGHPPIEATRVVSLGRGAMAPQSPWAGDDSLCGASVGSPSEGADVGAGIGGGEWGAGGLAGGACSERRCASASSATASTSCSVTEPWPCKAAWARAARSMTKSARTPSTPAASASCAAWCKTASDQCSVGKAVRAFNT